MLLLVGALSATGRGRVGSSGGVSLSSNASGLPGGLLNGEFSSEMSLLRAGRFDVTIGLGEFISNLSFLDAGGGGGCFGLSSLLSSTERRGGGGDGGCDAIGFGDLGGGGVGVRGRPIPSIFGDELSTIVVARESGFRKGDLSPGITRLETLGFGGDCGGSIVTAGGGRAASCGLRFGLGFSTGG